MKSERRHELQHNELAEWLFKTGEQLKPYQNLILAGVAAFVVAVAIYSWWSRNSATKAAEAWTALNRSIEAGNPDMLGNVADENGNNMVGQMANTVLGDWRLATGCQQRFKSMAISQKELSSAVEAYSKVLQHSRDQTLLERATYGMARTKETQGQLEDAAKYYKEVAEKWPEGAFAAAAKQRREDFKRLDTKLMFGDLRKYEPKPAFEEPGTLGLQPNLGELPQEPPVAPSGPTSGFGSLKTEPENEKAPATQPKADATKKSGGEMKAEAEPKKK
jgi:hypothetical protein